MGRDASEGEGEGAGTGGEIRSKATRAQGTCRMDCTVYIIVVAF